MTDEAIEESPDPTCSIDVATLDEIAARLEEVLGYTSTPDAGVNP